MRQTGEAGAISVVAPIALRERPDERRAWRAQVNTLARTRLRLMLRSFLLNIQPGLLAEFMIVCPDAEVPVLREEVRRITRGFPQGKVAAVRVRGESDLLAECGFEGSLEGYGGWVLQQVIKLFYARVCPTDYYLTMDSDILALRPLTSDTFFAPDGRGRQCMETEARYLTLYSRKFARKEARTKLRRFEAALDLLGAPPGFEVPLEVPSETPTLLAAEAARGLLDRLEARHGAALGETLRDRRGWTEYSIYYTHLAMTGERDRYHLIGYEDVLLALDASAWQLGARYRKGKRNRRFTRQHFQRAEAPFVAIQSWLPHEELLRGRTGGIGEFYADLEAWFAPPPRSLPRRVAGRIARALVARWRSLRARAAGRRPG